MSERQGWRKFYPEGVRWDATLPTGPVQAILETSARRFADHSALEFMGRKTTYRELDAAADRFAAGLQTLGVKPGAHVGLFLPNTPHYVIAFFGVLKAGGIVVNYSPLDAERVLEHKIADSETDVLVTLDLAALYPQMERLLGKTRLKTLVVGELAEMSPAPDLVRAQMQKAGMLSPVAYGERILAFRTLLEAGERPEATPLGDPAKTICALQYTGGTTGAPKGAMLTHANLTAANAQYRVTLASALTDGQERMLAVLPPFHIYALSVNMLLGLSIGAELALHARFDPAAAVKDIAEKQITVFCGVPTMFVAVLGLPGVKPQDLASLKVCTSGGAPLPLEVQEKFQALSGCRLCEGWGMTETSPTGTFTPADGPVKPGSCGIPLPGVEFKFADVADPEREAAPGERGEILIRGPNVLSGYWRQPEATRESMTRDGFFRTGDVGYMDADGYLYIVDRTKDMLLCGGFNVYPRVIEEALYQHPAIAEASVIGLPDPYRGQTPKAFVKLKAGAAAPSLAEMQTFLKDRIGKHEMIGALEAIEELPKTPVGKISKKDLYAREAAAGAS